jgi:hypothetical protein
MAKIDRQAQRNQFCFVSGCRAYRKCKVKWGRDCNRYGGSKVPRLRTSGLEMQYAGEI